MDRLGSVMACLLPVEIDDLAFVKIRLLSTDRLARLFSLLRVRLRCLSKLKIELAGVGILLGLGRQQKEIMSSLLVLKALFCPL